MTPSGQRNREGYWTTAFGSSRDAVATWTREYPEAFKNATLFDETVKKDAKQVSGNNYAALAELSVRQAFATFEITVGSEPDDVMAFLKEISSNGDMSVSSGCRCRARGVELTLPSHADHRRYLPSSSNLTLHRAKASQGPPRAADGLLCLWSM